MCSILFLRFGIHYPGRKKKKKRSFGMQPWIFLLMHWDLHHKNRLTGLQETLFHPSNTITTLLADAEFCHL